MPLLGAIGKQKFTKALVLAARRLGRRGGRRPRGARRQLALLAAPPDRLALHVLAGFWPQPIQWIGIAMGMRLLARGVALGIYGVAYWIDNANFPGPLFAGVGIVFVLGVQGFILALVGEYLGRIQRDVEGRPLYIVEKEI